MTNFNNTTQAANLDAAAVGRTSSNPFVDVFASRSPTPQDTQYPIQKKWLNTATDDYFILEALPSVSGTTTAVWIRIGSGVHPIEEVIVDAFSPPGTNPVLPDIINQFIITGGQVAAGTTPNVIRSDSLAASSITIEVQRSQDVPVSTIADNGVCHFDSASFDVDANGFVQLSGGGGVAVTKVEVDTFTGPGTNPVLADATGQITVTGGQVAAGTTPNAIITDSLAVNEYTIQIQRSQAVGAPTVADNGISHYDSSSFTVDANGFVQLVGGSGPAVKGIQVDAKLAPGTDPVLPDPVTGLITVTGGQVAAATTPNVIFTNSLAANTYTIDIQRSSTAGVSTVGLNGVCHFDSSSFTVDANGFVTAIGGSSNYTNVTFGMSPYVVLLTDQFISVDSTGGPVVLQFPNAPVFKQHWTIKDRTGTAAANTITLTTPGGIVTLDGLTSYFMNSNYQAVNILANATPTYEVY